MHETNCNWKSLYAIGGIAVFTNLVLMLVSVMGYIFVAGFFVMGTIANLAHPVKRSGCSGGR